MERTSRLFVVSGPSGAGKGTLVARIRAERPDLALTVSATTRSPREGEVADVSYHYLSEEDFSKKIDEGAFLEWADVHGHRYGTLKSEVLTSIEAGRSVILEIDVQGGFNVRKEYPEAVLIFVAPPSHEVLEARLRGRGSEDEGQIRLRLANAAREMEQAARYDAVVINDDLDQATHELLRLIERYESNGGYTHHGSDESRD